MTLDTLCKLFGYTRQAHYKQQREGMKRYYKEERILELIRDERELQPRMGTRKLYHLLRHKGIALGRDKLYTLLRENDLLVRPTKRFYVRTTTAGERARLFPNLVKDKSITAPNQVWVSDITYIRIKNGFAYLSLITDAYSRKIVGCCLHPSLDTEGCLNALNQAMGSLSWSELKGIIHHSDRGCQYCSKAYVKVLKAAHMKVSVTQKGDPYENALAERVNGILKAEWINEETYETFDIAKNRISQIIEIYNTRRLHSSIKYKTPQEVHKKAYTHSSRKARLKQLEVEKERGFSDNYFSFSHTPDSFEGRFEKKNN